MKLENIKQGFENLWDSMSDGWQRLRDSAGGALTRFSSSEKAVMPSKSEVDDNFYFPSQGWSMLGGDVFEDARRVVVRVEVPGMEKEDLSIEVVDNALVVRGEKHFERDGLDGRWRILQCAYGSFRRVVPLSAQVIADQAKASYRNGVLRVELPKAEPSVPQAKSIKVE